MIARQIQKNSTPLVNQMAKHLYVDINVHDIITMSG
nr:MAG TPA: hypothetical protein [Caudoviricetes sp.]